MKVRTTILAGLTIVLMAGAVLAFQPYFDTRNDYSVGTDPKAVCSVDLNHDNDLDLVVANAGSNSVSVLLNAGSGTFGDPVTYAVGNEPLGVCAADLDGDGNVDLATANQASGDVSVLWSTGSGTFSTAVRMDSAFSASCIVAADVNRDGRKDLVCGQLAGGIVVLVNQGGRTFGPAVTYPVLGNNILSIAVADFDRDEDMDVAAGHWGTTRLGVVLNNGDGTFAAAVSYPAVTSRGIAAEDLDGDGDADLVMTDNYDAFHLAVLKNNGDGSFAHLVAYDVGTSVGAYSRGVVLADADSDGDIDIATADYASNTVSVLLNAGFGTFGAPNIVPVLPGPWGIVLADFDRDGLNDLAVCNTSGYGEAIQRVSVLRNLGGGQFAIPPSYGGTSGQLQPAIVAGDLDGDGANDLILPDATGTYVQFLKNNGDGTLAGPDTVAIVNDLHTVTIGDFDNDGDQDFAVGRGDIECSVDVYLNDGTGSFLLASSCPMPRIVWTICSADLDRDGDLDIAVANYSAGISGRGLVSILTNNGHGELTKTEEHDLGYIDTWSIVAADLTGDLYPDLAVTDMTNDRVWVLLGTGGGTFAEGVPYSVGRFPRSVVAADFDLDGHVDLAVACEIPNEVTTLHNAGDGTFGVSATYTAGKNPTCISAGDLDGDGYIDLATSNWSSSGVTVLRNHQDGTFEPAVAFGVGMHPIGVVLAELNGDGSLDLAVADYGTGAQSQQVWVLENRMGKANGCCIGVTGNVDDDPSDLTDISDLGSLVTYLFFGGTISGCAAEANVDASADGMVDISDLSALVGFLFFGASLPVCP
jgi:hypothetical protein